MSGTAPGLRILALHCAGGTAAMFAPLAAHLRDTASVEGIDLPGRGHRFGEAPLRRMDQAAAYLQAVTDTRREGGLVLLGHSMGALIAHELARRFCAQGGARPLALIVLACRAPHLPDREDSLHILPDAMLRGRLARYVGTPPELLADDEMMALVLPRLRADFELCETRQRRAPVPMALPLLALGGRADPEVAEDDLLAWAAHTRGPFRCRRIEGGHFFMQGREAETARQIAIFLQDFATGPPSAQRTDA